MASIGDYRERLLQLYKRCLITGYDALQCDAAHIIPRAVCYKLSLFELVRDIYNGIILCKDLHLSFDLYLWCFDPFDAIYDSPSSEWCTVPVIVKPNKKHLTVNAYDGCRYRIPVRSLPFIWVHYHIFTADNFGSRFKNMNISTITNKQYYAGLLGSEEYAQLLVNPRIIENWKQNLELKSISYIVGKRRFGTEYLVVPQYTPWREKYWANTENLDKKLLQSFEAHNEIQSDPDFTAPKSY